MAARLGANFGTHVCCQVPTLPSWLYASLSEPLAESGRNGSSSAVLIGRDAAAPPPHKGRSDHARCSGPGVD